MKNKKIKSKLTLDKYRVTKLRDLRSIRGGDGGVETATKPPGSSSIKCIIDG